MKIKTNTDSIEYRGEVQITFDPNENVTVTLTDGRKIDVFADGSWQMWQNAEMAAQGHFTAPVAA